MVGRGGFWCNRPMRYLWRVLVILLVAGVTACQTPTTSTAPPEPGPDAVTIFVTSNGWHTGIAIARGDLPAAAVPEAADFPDARYLEFGWGDAAYYPAKDPGPGMALAAALKPTPAFVHLVGLSAPPNRVFPKANIVTVRVARERFGALVRYLDAAFARNGAARAQPSAPGLYSFSKFYPATGEFDLFNTCNNWTARGLVAAGLPVGTTGIIRAESLMNEVRALAAE